MNSKGFATIETVVLTVVFMVLITYGVGFFGSIHTGVLNSIAARTYAWETFSQRTNLTIFRDQDLGGNSPTLHYNNMGFRAHTIISEAEDGSLVFFATERLLRIADNGDLIGRNPAQHNVLDFDLTQKKRNTQGVNPLWVRTTYGICLNADCGGVEL